MHWHSSVIGAVLSPTLGTQGGPEILPRRLHRRGGASVVRRDIAANRMEDLNVKIHPEANNQ
jgi:hypothetical protein